MTSTPRKVLIVDDDKVLVDIYTRKFNTNGYEVASVGSAAEALARFRDGYSPDVVMLDIIMPTMDGLELLAEIRKEKLAPGAVFIVLSNQGQQTEISKAEGLGIAGYIVKASTIPSEVVKAVALIYEKRKIKN